MGTHYAGDATERRALDTYIKLSRAADAVTGAINAHLRDYQLTISQFGVLEAIYHLGPLQAGELARKILKSSGNLTLVLDNLTRRSLVRRERREDDRRCIDIHLTDDGRALIESILPRHVAGVVATFGALSADEQEQLAALSRKLGLAVATGE